jgi:hypothetical protein
MIGRSVYKRLTRCLSGTTILLVTSVAAAQTRQDDVLRSIQQNVGGTVDPKALLGAVGVIGGIIVTMIAVNALRKRASRPKVVNHRGKLLKEISRNLSLKPAEMRQLKSLAENEEVESPLVFLLCPSLLNKAVKSAGDRIDRSAITSLARRLAKK